MKLRWLLPLALPAVISCGGGDFGSGLEGQFKTVILYAAGTDPVFLEADAIKWTTANYVVNALDQNQGSCTASTTVQLCVLPTFKTEPITVNFVLEPKKDYKGNNIVPFPSPVLLQQANIRLTPLTVGCPAYSFIQSMNFTLKPADDGETQSVQVSVVPHTLKEDITERLASGQRFTYIGDDGCSTAITLPMLNVTCEYRVDVSVRAVEIYTGDVETINLSFTLRITDYQTEEECLPGNP